ncbi:MAG: hypothetical protein KDC41_22045, partial [Saprospiraceae bacterium]|nr:hypothetical protein [Saprospiraceae bacterium]
MAKALKAFPEPFVFLLCLLWFHLLQPQKTQKKGSIAAAHDVQSVGVEHEGDDEDEAGHGGP